MDALQFQELIERMLRQHYAAADRQFFGDPFKTGRPSGVTFEPAGQTFYPPPTDPQAHPGGSRPSYWPGSTPESFIVTKGADPPGGWQPGVVRYLDGSPLPTPPVLVPGPAPRRWR